MTGPPFDWLRVTEFNGVRPLVTDAKLSKVLGSSEQKVIQDLIALVVSSEFHQAESDKLSG